MNGVTPLMLRSFGRSGSTLMMELLGSSKNVLFERTYPFENRYLTYFARLVGVCGLDHANGVDWNHDSLMLPGVKRVGPLPYANVKLFDKARLPGLTIKSLWSAFSDELRETSNLVGKVYYAEKVAQDICAMVNDNLYAKNLFLFRDPRDEFLSIKSFNKKRGYSAFGWSENDDDFSFARRLCISRRSFMRNILEIKQGEERRHLVIYEQLVANPEEITERLSNWLGLQLNWAKTAEEGHKYAHHMTTPDLDSSAQRWRREMTAELAEVFSEEIGAELKELGYEL